MITIPIMVVGLGQWGKHWLEDLQTNPEYEIKAIVDANTEIVDAVGTQFNLPRNRRYTSLKSAIENTTPGLAVITVPPNQHFEVVKELILAGFHILSEKPLATSLKEAIALRELSEKQSRFFMVSQDYRWQPPIQTLRQQIENKKIGDLGYATYRHFQCLRIGGWREQMEHVILEDMAIHHFDIMRAITGYNCLEVYAESHNPSWSWYHGGAITSVQLSFEHDFHVNYFATWITSGAEDSWPGEILIEGSKGALTMDAKGQIYSHVGEKSETIPWVTMELTGRKQALFKMKRALATGKAPETNIQDNINSFAITQAALLSVRQHRPVKMEEVFNAAMD